MCNGTNRFIRFVTYTYTQKLLRDEQTYRLTVYGRVFMATFKLNNVFCFFV